MQRGRDKEKTAMKDGATWMRGDSNGKGKLKGGGPRSKEEHIKQMEKEDSGSVECEETRAGMRWSCVWHQLRISCKTLPNSPLQ